MKPVEARAVRRTVPYAWVESTNFQFFAKGGPAKFHFIDMTGARLSIFHEPLRMFPEASVSDLIWRAAETAVEPLIRTLVREIPESRRLTLQMTELNEKVQDLVEELRQRPICRPVLIVDLGDPEVELNQPVQVVIEEYAEETTATWPEIEAFGSGDSDAEAILALKADIVELYLSLKETPDEELGILSLAWKKTLNKLIRSNGAPELQA